MPQPATYISRVFCYKNKKLEPEGATRIVNMGNVKKTFYNGYGMMKWQKTQDEPFGELIQQNNDAGDNHQLYIFVLQHFLILWCQF